MAGKYEDIQMLRLTAGSTNSALLSFDETRRTCVTEKGQVDTEMCSLNLFFTKAV